jgi:HD-like signal output (HDOD) protein
MSRQLAKEINETLWFGDDDPARSQAQASASLAAGVAKAVGLKPFPAVAQRVMQMAASADCSVEELARLIRNDPAIAARVMRLANSALFKVGEAVGSLDQALTRLGTNTLYQMVASIAVMGFFDTRDKAARRLRDHAVGTAALAKALAHKRRLASANQLFLCGLLHDIGQLLLLQTQEISYQAFTPEQLTFDQPPVRERELLGYDHAVLGGHVVAVWNMPQLTAQAVAWHHQPARAKSAGGDIAQLVAFVRFADELDELLADASQTPLAVRSHMATSTTTAELECPPEELEQHWDFLIESRKTALSTLC